jgi:hypothetical protein
MENNKTKLDVVESILLDQSFDPDKNELDLIIGFLEVCNKNMQYIKNNFNFESGKRTAYFIGIQEGGNFQVVNFDTHVTLKYIVCIFDLSKIVLSSLNNKTLNWKPISRQLLENICDVLNHTQIFMDSITAHKIPVLKKYHENFQAIISRSENDREIYDHLIGV